MDTTGGCIGEPEVDAWKLEVGEESAATAGEDNAVLADEDERLKWGTPDPEEEVALEEDAEGVR